MLCSLVGSCRLWLINLSMPGVNLERVAQCAFPPASAELMGTRAAAVGRAVVKQ